VPGVCRSRRRRRSARPRWPEGHCRRRARRGRPAAHRRPLHRPRRDRPPGSPSLSAAAMGRGGRESTRRRPTTGRGSGRSSWRRGGARSPALPFDVGGRSPERRLPTDRHLRGQVRLASHGAPCDEAHARRELPMVPTRRQRWCLQAPASERRTTTTKSTCTRSNSLVPFGPSSRHSFDVRRRCSGPRGNFCNARGTLIDALELDQSVRCLFAERRIRPDFADECRLDHDPAVRARTLDPRCPRTAGCSRPGVR